MTPTDTTNTSGSLAAVLRHEGRWAAGLAVLATIIHLLIQIDETPGKTWIYPLNNYVRISFAFQATAATLLGLLAALADDLLRTREYLRHRPISPARLFWARHLLGLAAVTFWLLAVPTLHLVLVQLTSPDAPLIQGRRWGMLVLQDLPAYLYYALAVFAAVVTRRLSHALVFSGLVALGASALVGMSLVLAPVNYRGWVTGASVLLTPLFLIAAQACWVDGRDRDRPWDGRRLALAGPALLLIAGVAGSLGGTFLFASASENLLDNYPDVASNGREYALGNWSKRDQAMHRLGIDHRSHGELLPDGWDLVWSPRGGAWQDAFNNRPQQLAGGQRWVYADPRRQLTGYLADGGPMTLYRTARFDGNGNDRPWLRLLAKAGLPPGAPNGFSARDRAAQPALLATAGAARSGR